MPPLEELHREADTALFNRIIDESRIIVKLLQDNPEQAKRIHLGISVTPGFTEATFNDMPVALFIMNVQHMTDESLSAVINPLVEAILEDCKFKRDYTHIINNPVPAYITSEKLTLLLTNLASEKMSKRQLEIKQGELDFLQDEIQDLTDQLRWLQESNYGLN